MGNVFAVGFARVLKFFAVGFGLLGGENRAVRRETTQDRPLKMLYMSMSFAEG